MAKLEVKCRTRGELYSLYFVCFVCFVIVCALHFLCFFFILCTVWIVRDAFCVHCVFCRCCMCCDCVYMWMLCFGCLRETVYDLFVCIFLNIYCTFSVPDWIVCWSEFRVLCVCVWQTKTKPNYRKTKEIENTTCCAVRLVLTHERSKKFGLQYLFFTLVFTGWQNTPCACLGQKQHGNRQCHWRGTLPTLYETCTSRSIRNTRSHTVIMPTNLHCATNIMETLAPIFYEMKKHDETFHLSL